MADYNIITTLKQHNHVGILKSLDYENNSKASL